MTELQRYQLYSVVLTAELGYSLYLYYKLAKRYRKNVKETSEIVQYFGDVLNRNEVPIQEFDLIALKAMGINVKLSPKEAE